MSSVTKHPFKAGFRRFPRALGSRYSHVAMQCDALDPFVQLGELVRSGFCHSKLAVVFVFIHTNDSLSNAVTYINLTKKINTVLFKAAFRFFFLYESLFPGHRISVRGDARHTTNLRCPEFCDELLSFIILTVKQHTRLFKTVMF